MAVKGKKGNRFKYLLPIALLGIMAVAACRPGIVKADPGIDPNAEFMEFWSDYQSIFLYHPSLVRQIFLDIINLKGNRRTALKKIDTEVLTCSNSISLSECRLDQLKLERKERKISRYKVVRVNIESVTGHPFKKNKQKYVLFIRWEPVIVKPPVIPISEFYDYLGVARDSRYYSSKHHLTRIQINPLFEEVVTVVSTAAEARNLIDLYRNPPADLKDFLVFKVDRTVMTPTGYTASFDFHLKAVKININHISFKTTKELLQ